MVYTIDSIPEAWAWVALLWLSVTGAIFARAMAVTWMLRRRRASIRRQLEDPTTRVRALAEVVRLYGTGR